MTAKELMIGDWVDWNSPQGKRPVILKDWMRIAMEFKNCNPIPLTAEILEKNGIRFQYGKIWYQIHNDNLQIVYSDDTIEMRKDVHYVHELQHALRLCGLNELADTFKV